MLTNAAVKAARPRAAAYKLSDAGGLYLYIAPTNLRSWRWRFRWQGREQLLTIGSGFEMTLDQARARRDQAREQLGRGEDPRQARCEIDAKVRAFEYVSRRWHAHMLSRWTAVHAADVIASFERDVFPAIGAMPIGAITTPVILNALRAIEERGRRETARRVRQRISAVFAFAIAEGVADHDPAAIVAKALMPPAPAQHHPALLDIEDARALLAAAERVDAAAPIKLSTVLNERLPDQRVAIDRALGHAGDGAAEGINRKVEAAYNRSEQRAAQLAATLAARRALFETWAAALGGGCADV